VLAFRTKSSWVQTRRQSRQDYFQGEKKEKSSEHAFLSEGK
jgi:hypothetical protein